MTTPKTILLTRPGIHEEYPASAALKPGHLIELLSTGKVQKHATQGGVAERMFATEDALQGKTTVDAYAADDIVMCDIAPAGAVRLARVAAAAAAIGVSDKLVSAGDGTLKLPAASGASVLYDNTAASADVSNGVTTEQFFNKSYTLPANSLAVGDILDIEGWAVVSAQGGTDTLTVKLYLGSITLVTTAAVDSAVNDVVYVKATVVVRAVGATGAIVAGVLHTNGVAGTATVKSGFVASTAIDTTAAQVIRASATWSATTATNTVALQALRVTRQRTAPQELLCMALEAVDNSAGSDEAFLRVRVLT
jgi:hypothetical protein